MPDVTTGLREALDALNAQWEAQLAQAKDGDKDKLTRPNVVALLTVIADHLAPALYQQHGDIDGHPVVSDHDAVAVLQRFIEHYNHARYHESLENVTPADAYFGRAADILRRRAGVKRQTLEHRRLRHRKIAA